MIEIKLRGRQSEVDTELRDFMVVLRRALLLIVRYIEKRYNVA